MSKLISLMLVMLAAGVFSQNDPIDNIPVRPYPFPEPIPDPLPTPEPIDIAASRCPEVSNGPSYYVPWFPWPGPCVLVWAWVSWYPFPPRICYIWRCRFNFGSYSFYIYFKYCRILWWRQAWSLNTDRITPANFNLKEGSSTSDTFSASSNLNDLVGDQRVNAASQIKCSYTANLNAQVAKASLPQNY